MGSKMSEAQEEDEMERVPIPLKNVSSAISKKESELKELKELAGWVVKGFSPNPGISGQKPHCRKSCLREAKVV